MVTDSTAGLTGDLAARYGIRLVPLRVVHGEVTVDDGPAALVLARLSAGSGELRGSPRLGTAGPAPERFAAAYAAAAAAGARAVVSVHLSAELSGTVNAASVAAAGAAVPVRVVDSRSLGMGLGFAALAAAEAAAAGQALEDVAAAASLRSARLRSFFALDSLDQLRAGGRLVDPAPGLTARPLLQVTGGAIVLLEKVRTPSAAVRRLEDTAVQFAAGRPVDLAVQYLGHRERAAALAARLEQLIPGARRRYLGEAGAVIRAHTGPGMLGVVVAPY